MQLMSMMLEIHSRSVNNITVNIISLLVVVEVDVVVVEVPEARGKNYDSNNNLLTVSLDVVNVLEVELVAMLR